MKILYSAYTCNPYKGSESGLGWNWAYCNALLGHEVWCLTRTFEKQFIEEKLKEIPALKLNFIYIELPLHIKKLHRYLPGVYLKYLLWQHAAYKVAKQKHDEINFDLIHHTAWGSFQLGTELWKLDAPLIFGPVGGGQVAPPEFKSYFHEHWRSEVNRNRMSNLLLKLNPNTKKMAKKAALILSTNDETTALTKKTGAQRVEFFLDTGLPADFYPPTCPKRDSLDVMRILWVGRLFARKGLPLVLEALSKVKPHVKFKLTIVGDGPMAKYVPDWIKDFQLEDKVDWKGRVPWTTVKNAYLHHDVFMFCSLRDSVAVQLLEAMAYGLPVITLNQHGAKKVVQDNAGIKIEPTTKNETVLELAKAVETMYSDPKLRAEMGSNGYTFAKTCTWTEKAAQIQKYYMQVVHAEQPENKVPAILENELGTIKVST